MLLDPAPPLVPADWASAWGEDAYGLWQAVSIAGVRQVLRWIPPGRFIMGSPEDEPGREGDEVKNDVTLTRGFWLAETTVTQALWQAVTGANPSVFEGDADLPVDSVSWKDCQGFLERANACLTEGPRLRLPTEAEWEYACRAGTRTAFHFGDVLDTERANYDGNYPYNRGAKGEYRERTLPVHAFSPNPWGLYQMHGNLWEWCADWYGAYPVGPVTNPEGPPDGRGRVVRGASWSARGRGLRSAFRYHSPADDRSHDLGLRLAAS